MRKYKKKTILSLTKVFELIGKPFFFLFTILIVLVASYLHFLSVIIKKVSSYKFPKLPSLPKISIPRPSQNIIYLSFLIIFFTSIYYFLIYPLPSIKLLIDQSPALSTKIYDRSGELLYQIYQDENRSLVKLDNLPTHLINATIAAEDKNFYKHFGVDPLGILRALYNNTLCYFQSGSCLSLQGGSTITQQLIKNTLLSNEKTLTRKFKEMVLAIEAEYYFDKKTILELYLNQVPYGGTAYGIEEAARQYLGKSSHDLTLAESAFLAGLPISPTTLSPFGSQPYLAQNRQHQVLDNMLQLKLISIEQKNEALQSPIALAPNIKEIKAPHFVMYVKDYLVSQFGETVVSRGGLTVKTTLSLEIQNTLESEINSELSRLAKLNVKNGAGLVISPPTGEILAMVGSKNFFDSQNDGQVNVVLQPRQPGSAIKPLTYSLAFLRGLSPSSIISDTPICFRQVGSSDYCPKNYDGRFHGEVTLKTALANSYNIPAIKLLNSLGIKNLLELAQSMGISTWNDSTRYGLSLTLGGGEITMLDLAQVYSVFATNGYKVPFSSIISITDSHGNDLTPSENLFPKNVKQVIPETVAFQINQILSDRQARSAAFGYNSILHIPTHQTAVKTGTTNNLRDNWTFGYTPDLLVATWVGNNDNSPMSSVASGITGASPIWSRTITKLLSNYSSKQFSVPENIVKARTSCNGNVYDYFIKGTEPKLDCVNPPGQIL